jgi:hypothetical protein
MERLCKELYGEDLGNRRPVEIFKELVKKLDKEINQNDIPILEFDEIPEPAFYFFVNGNLSFYGVSKKFDEMIKKLIEEKGNMYENLEEIVLGTAVSIVRRRVQNELVDTSFWRKELEPLYKKLGIESDKQEKYCVDDNRIITMHAIEAWRKNMGLDYVIEVVKSDENFWRSKIENLIKS